MNLTGTRHESVNWIQQIQGRVLLRALVIAVWANLVTCLGVISFSSRLSSMDLVTMFYNPNGVF
jgi:hypothetical protein